MALKYHHSQVEPKWQAVWEEKALFQDSANVDKGDQVPGASNQKPAKTKELAADDRNLSNKIYLLFAFAYPSGSGLHVGHVESKTALDILARFYRMSGRDVFFPVGWDAFGLPAENYAIKTGVPPVKTTIDAIKTFRRQIKRVGISYDWANEIATSHPEYYKWTQWIFLELFSKGLAYKKPGMVNWCPSCQTVLANEQVINGHCERCDHEVVQKDLNQWYFKITHYKDELIEGLDHVDWPKPTEDQQKHWIGKSEGANVKFRLQVVGDSDQNIDDNLEVYTTAHDTIYGCTFMVVAPEHELLTKYQNLISNNEEIKAYIKQANAKTELERQSQKEKTGIMVEGLELINPVNNQVVPLYVADYVLAGYGTGAIMAVPGHDQRDYEFAQKYGLPVIQTAQPSSKSDTSHDFISYADIKADREAYKMVNSGEFNGMDYVKGRQAILDRLIRQSTGQATNQYKIRDWLISRQRYWGAPIPIVYDPEGKAHPVEAGHLPWTLPTDVEFKPTGESPLKNSKELKERVEKLYGKGWTPEYDTMDTFVDSSWYFMRFVDSRNKKAFASKDQLEKWLPVDFYMIGPEHIVLHLLYARFFTKFLRDQGYLCEVKFKSSGFSDLPSADNKLATEDRNLKSNLDPDDHQAHREAGLFCIHEPFMKMRHQGMILGPDHRKMSKSKGNVIDPDVVIKEHGADALRMYEMFMGPIEADKPWNDRSVIGVRRFLDELYDLIVSEHEAHGSTTKQSYSLELQKHLHRTLKKVTEDIPELKFNTAIASLMEFKNHFKQGSNLLGSLLSREDLLILIRMIAPFAPFMAEELFQSLGFSRQLSDTFVSVHQQDWPEFDPKLVVEDTATVVVQVNGKVRDSFEVSLEGASDNKALEDLAKKQDKVASWLKDKIIHKVICIPPKPGKNAMVNFVVK